MNFLISQNYSGIVNDWHAESWDETRLFSVERAVEVSDSEI